MTIGELKEVLDQYADDYIVKITNHAVLMIFDKDGINLIAKSAAYPYSDEGDMTINKEDDNA